MRILGRDKSCLGLDIGSHMIKLVEVKHVQKEPVITFAKSKAIPQPDNDDELPSDEDVFETLQELVEECKVRKKRVVTAVSSSLAEQVDMRSIFIENLPGDAPAEVLRLSVEEEYRAQDFIAFIDNAQIDCHVEGETRGGVNAFVVAVNRDLIDRQVDMLRGCGLIPIAIDVDFLAISRLITATTQLSEEDDIAILDIGGKKTAVGFYQHGRLHHYPHVEFGGAHRTFQVAQNMQVWDALEAILDGELAQDLYDRFDVYEREFPDYKPSKAILSGGAAQIPQLYEFLSGRLSIPIDTLHYLDQISVDTDGDVEDLNGNELLFSTAVGLALKQIS